MRCKGCKKNIEPLGIKEKNDFILLLGYCNPECLNQYISGEAIAKYINNRFPDYEEEE